MAKQFFIPASKYLPADLAEQQGGVYSYLKTKVPLDAGEISEDKLIYSFSYIDSNNDEISYKVGQEHPFKSVGVLVIFKVDEVYYIFSDEESLSPERLDFSGHNLDKIGYFDPRT